MKSAEARDAMVARVQAAYALYPTFASVPVVHESSEITVRMRGDFDSSAYVAALYELLAVAELVGRSAEGGALTGTRLVEG